MTIERPTNERLAKALGEYEERVVSMTENDVTTDVIVIQMLDGHLITRLESRGVLNTHQVSAAKRFIQDCHMAGMLTGSVIDPGRVVVDGGNSEPAQDRQVDAYSRVKRVLDRIGMIHRRVLTDLLLFEMTREVFAKKYHLPYKDEKDRMLVVNAKIQDALTELDYIYYGQRQDKPRHAMQPGSRPFIQPANQRS